MGDGLETARLSVEEEKVRSDLCPSPSTSSQSRVLGKAPARAIKENDYFRVQVTTRRITTLLDKVILIRSMLIVWQHGDMLPLFGDDTPQVVAW